MDFLRSLFFVFWGMLQISDVGAKDQNICQNNSVEKSVIQGNSQVGVRLAVISLRAIARNSKAGQSIDKQIEEINNKSKEDLLELENSIKKMDSDAKTGSDERKVEELQVILYDMTKEKRHQIQSAYRSAIEVLEKEIQKVVKEIADEKGYTLIMLSDVVVYGTSGCPDITEETVKRLDDKIPEIKVHISKSPER